MLGPTLLDLLNLVLSRNCMPAAWKPKLLMPMYKRGGRHLASNYRPIAVSTIYYRLFVRIMGERLTGFVEGSAGCLQPYQFGFRPGLSTHHAHLVVATCCDIARVKNQPGVIMKLDIAGAYDTVLRPRLWQELLALGIPTGFVAVLRELYRGAPYVVNANGVFSRPFNNVVGLMQGCALSPALYNLYCTRAYGRVHDKMVGHGLEIRPDTKCVQSNYADDTLPLLNKFEAIPAYVDAFQREFEDLNQLCCLGCPSVKQRRPRRPACLRA